MYRDLGNLLADPSHIGDLTTAELPIVLAAIASELARLAAVQGALAARLAAAPLPASDIQNSRLLTQEEASERYRIPLRLMRRITRTKRIPSTRIGRNRMVRQVDLDGYISRCQRQGVAVGTVLDV